MEPKPYGVLSKFNNKLKYINSNQCNNCNKLNELYWYNIVIKNLMENNNKQSFLHNTFIVQRNNIINLKKYFKNNQYWIFKKITSKKNDILTITDKFNDIVDILKLNGEDIYILQHYNTNALLYDGKLIFYRFYIITILEYPNKKSYSIYHNNSILLANNLHSIDNWKELCFEHIFPHSFEYYFGHETYINQIIPKSKKLINTIINPILDFINNTTEQRWPYYHVFTVDISFTTNIEPKLENISELYTDKLYNRCDTKNNTEKIFFNNLNQYIKDLLFKKQVALTSGGNLRPAISPRGVRTSPSASNETCRGHRGLQLSLMARGLVLIPPGEGEMTI